MGNTASVKAHSHKHSEVSCTMKHGRRAFRHSHKHKRKHYRRRGGSSPLNPSHVPSSSSTLSSTKKKRGSKKNIAPSLLKIVLKNETRKIYPKGLPRKSTPIKRNIIVVEKSSSQARRKSL
jgi:hypothetical protein